MKQSGWNLERPCELPLPMAAARRPLGMRQIGIFLIKPVSDIRFFVLFLGVRLQKTGQQPVLRHFSVLIYVDGPFPFYTYA